MQIAKRSKGQGFSSSRLPEFSVKDAEIVRGSSDFMGVNFYSGAFASPAEYPMEDVSYFSDRDASTKHDPDMYG